MLPIGWDTETTISELSKLTILNHFIYVIPGAESLFITVVLGSSEFLPQPVFKNWRPAVLRIAHKEAYFKCLKLSSCKKGFQRPFQSTD